MAGEKGVIGSCHSFGNAELLFGLCYIGNSQVNSALVGSYLDALCHLESGCLAEVNLIRQFKIHYVSISAIGNLPLQIEGCSSRQCVMVDNHSRCRQVGREDGDSGGAAIVRGVSVTGRLRGDAHLQLFGAKEGHGECALLTFASS